MAPEMVFFIPKSFREVIHPAIEVQYPHETGKLHGGSSFTINQSMEYPLVN